MATCIKGNHYCQQLVSNSRELDLMEKWFCIWQISDKPKNCLCLTRPSPTSKTLAFIVKKKTLKTKNRINILTLLKQIKYEN